MVGYKNSGKTKIVEAIVSALKSKGHRIGTIKHVPEPDFEFDVPGKDSWKHYRAGAEMVAVISSEKQAMIEKNPTNILEIIGQMQKLDFVIIEGFREMKNVARIVVAREDSEIPELSNKFTIAVIRSKDGQPAFNASELVSIVERKSFPILPDSDCGRCGYKTCDEFRSAVIREMTKGDECKSIEKEVALLVDGREIPLNPFVQLIFKNVVGAMISSLKGGKGKDAVVRVKLHEG